MRPVSSALGKLWTTWKTLLPKRALHSDFWLQIYNEIDRKHTWAMAASMAFYSLLSLFPALILFSAVVAFLPGNALFDRTLNILAMFLPPSSMHTVRGVLADVITPNRGAYFSIGLLGTLWSISNAVTATIEALNVAYDVVDRRPFWKIRILAFGMALFIGGLFVTALAVMILGPRFGEWLAARLLLSRLFALLWPVIHWAIAVGFTVLGIVALYLLAPCGERHFRATLPGAAVAVGCWLGLSYLLGQYFRHFANFDKTYGALGGVIALLIWLYWTGFAILLGAELNAQLAYHQREHPAARRQPPEPMDAAA